MIRERAVGLKCAEDWERAAEGEGIVEWERVAARESTDRAERAVPPKRIVAGERVVMGDCAGNDRASRG